MDINHDHYQIMFVRIAMLILGVSAITTLTSSLTVYNILRCFIDAFIISAYYLLTKEKKIGFSLMWLGSLCYVLQLYLLTPNHTWTFIFFSTEFLLNIFVTCSIIKILKKMK